MDVECIPRPELPPRGEADACLHISGPKSASGPAAAFVGGLAIPKPSRRCERCARTLRSRQEDSRELRSSRKTGQFGCHSNGPRRQGAEQSQTNYHDAGSSTDRGFPWQGWANCGARQRRVQAVGSFGRICDLWCQVEGRRFVPARSPADTSVNDLAGQTGVTVIAGLLPEIPVTHPATDRIRLWAR